MSGTIKIIECPRDAMQGIKTFIPTENKVRYIQSLLNCGFDTIDFGSFVSPKAIPQMADTAEVLKQLDLSKTQSKLDRKSTRLNSSHVRTSYAVFCVKKKNHLGLPGREPDADR